MLRTSKRTTKLAERRRLHNALHARTDSGSRLSTATGDARDHCRRRRRRTTTTAAVDGRWVAAVVAVGSPRPRSAVKRIVVVHYRTPFHRTAERAVAAAARTPRLCPMVKPAVTSAHGGDTVNGVRACDVPLRHHRRIWSPRTASVSVFLVPKRCDFSRLSSRATPAASPLHRQPPHARVAATAAAAAPSRRRSSPSYSGDSAEAMGRARRGWI